MLRNGRRQGKEQEQEQEQDQEQAVTATPTSPPFPREEDDDGAAATKPPTLPATSTESRSFAAGDYCLAPRVFDRRRARAVVEEVLVPGCNGTCLVTWLHPRQRGELVCRYWKEVSQLRAAFCFGRCSHFFFGGGAGRL